MHSSGRKKAPAVFMFLPKSLTVGDVQSGATVTIYAFLVPQKVSLNSPRSLYFINVQAVGNTFCLTADRHLKNKIPWRAVVYTVLHGDDLMTKASVF